MSLMIFPLYRRTFLKDFKLYINTFYFVAVRYEMILQYNKNQILDYVLFLVFMINQMFEKFDYCG